MSKKDNSSKAQSRPHTLSIGLSIVAILVSSFSLWESHQARTLSYESSLPAIDTTVELEEPLEPGKQIQFKVKIDNLGKTPARRMSTVLGWKFQKRELPFDPTYPENPSFLGPTSDLAPGGHTTLITTNPLSLAHDHDVEAVTKGLFRLYLYGKSTYKDVMENPHEVHLCRYYERVAGAEPLKLAYCDSYNDSN